MLEHSLDLMAPMRRAPLVQERADVGNLIGSLGRSRFESELVRCLHEMYGADHLFVCQLCGGQPRPRMLATLSQDGSQAAERLCNDYLGETLWRFDPSMAEGSNCSSGQPLVRHLNTETPETRQLHNFYSHQHVRERVVVFGSGPEGAALSLSIVRSVDHGSFTEEQRERLSLLGGILFPLLVKHRQLQWEHKQLPNSVTSLKQIERCLALAPEKIPRREAQVIARTLYGLTATGIALDLDIGRETVITYRKSFYKRLEIAGFRELLLWYLRLYSNVGDQALFTTSPGAVPQGEAKNGAGGSSIHPATR
jgi:DNA-binding CsgD family transcriptional regulator